MDEYKEEEEEEKEEEDGGVSTKEMVLASQSLGGDVIVPLTQLLSSPQSPQQVFSQFFFWPGPQINKSVQ